MILRWLLAWAHLIALGIGLGAVWARGRALHAGALGRALTADTWWGLAAALWITTGLARAFGPFEKGAPYYLGNGFFQLKMALLLAILLLEVAPMIALIRWRIALAKGLEADTRHAAAFARISEIQGALVVLMVLCATAMARGVRFP